MGAAINPAVALQLIGIAVAAVGLAALIVALWAFWHRWDPPPPDDDEDPDPWPPDPGGIGLPVGLARCDVRLAA